MISVFTPFHKKDTLFLQLAYQSLLEQTFQDWEWIIVLNGESERTDLDILNQDQRVKIYDGYNMTGNIGSLKHYACTKCIGYVLAEMDYDDILTSDCLFEVNQAFQDNNVQMAYSNDALFISDTWEPFVFSSYYGWRTREFQYKEKKLKESRAWPPSSQMMRRVEWAPDHIRAWRKVAYNKIGGHDKTLSIGDDHDLCCRFYIEYGQAGIKHIDKCLYLYRKQSGNSSVVNNSGIQEQTDKNYCKYSRELAARWAKDNGLRMIDLGGRFECPKGYESVDRMDADIVCDLNQDWPFKDGEIGIIRANHTLEHLKNPIHFMNEAYRVLAGGGWLFIEVPSTDGRGAWQDPTHISFFNINSFWYYYNQHKARYIAPEYTGKFQLARSVTYFPNEEFRMNDIPCVQADLLCLKPPYSNRPCGEVLWDLNEINDKFIK